MQWIILFKKKKQPGNSGDNFCIFCFLIPQRHWIYISTTELNTLVWMNKETLTVTALEPPHFGDILLSITPWSLNTPASATNTGGKVSTLCSFGIISLALPPLPSCSPFSPRCPWIGAVQTNNSSLQRGSGRGEGGHLLRLHLLSFVSGLFSPASVVLLCRGNQQSEPPSVFRLEERKQIILRLADTLKEHQRKCVLISFEIKHKRSLWVLHKHKLSLHKCQGWWWGSLNIYCHLIPSQPVFFSFSLETWLCGRHRVRRALVTHPGWLLTLTRCCHPSQSHYPKLLIFLWSSVLCIIVLQRAQLWSCGLISGVWCSWPWRPVRGGRVTGGEFYL